VKWEADLQLEPIINVFMAGSAKHETFIRDCEGH